MEITFEYDTSLFVSFVDHAQAPSLIHTPVQEFMNLLGSLQLYRMCASRYDNGTLNTAILLVHVGSPFM